MKGLLKTGGGLFSFLLVAGIVAGYEPTQTSQIGWNGVGMQITDSEERLADRLKANEVPVAPPIVKSGPLAADAYENVQVLGHLTTSEFIRTMNAITAWVSPSQGCAYCHDNTNLATDTKYTKVVSRRMLQMTMHINEDLKEHVAETGVTCFTCHRGQPVPRYIWHEQPEDAHASTYLGYRADQNSPRAEGLTSLPTTALEEFLLKDTSIRVQTDGALPGDNRSSIKQTEWTYALMVHFSRSLGVNCTFCHNSRQWSDWSQSPTQRATAWQGIQMVRHLNNDWLVPLTETFPPERLGPKGDGPKLNCATCHQGAYKPLLGKSMVADYPELAKPMPQPAKSPKPAQSAALDVDVEVGDDAGVAGAAAGAAP